MSYIPLGFVDGEYLNAEKLNYMESGIIDTSSANGFIASGFEQSLLPLNTNVAVLCWDSSSPMGDITGGVARLIGGTNTSSGLVYKPLAIGALVNNVFPIVCNSDGTVALKSLVTPTSSTDATPKSYVDSDWTPVSETWTYASPTTITVPTGAVSRYQKFDKIKYTQSNSVKYGRVLSVSDTVITLIPSGVYAVANSTISNISISRKATPFGFPNISAWRHSFASASNVFVNGSSYYVINDNNTLSMSIFFAATGSYIANTQIVFTLPTGFRPSVQLMEPIAYQLAGQTVRHPCDLQINTNGEAKIYYPLSETVVQYLFSNITVLL